MPGPIIGIGELLWDMLPSGPRAGGAPFNFAFHCQQLGHPAVIVSRVGDDDLGRQLLEEVRRLGLSDEFIQIDPNHRTGTVSVGVDSAGQPNYTIADEVAWDHLEWREEFNSLIRSARTVCFGTLAQRTHATRQTLHRFVASSRSNRSTICDLNLRPPFADEETIKKSIRLADLLKLNESELDEVRSHYDTVRRMEHLYRNDSDRRRQSILCGLDLALMCITRGDRGCALWTFDEEIDVPGLPIEVADTVGAGDAFTAGLVTQMFEGSTLADAARFANALAALVASRPGGTPKVDRAEVEALC
jgi:fructokinase